MCVCVRACEFQTSMVTVLQVTDKISVNKNSTFKQNLERMYLVNNNNNNNNIIITIAITTAIKIL